MIAYYYHQQLLLVPVLVIALVAALAIMLRFPRYKKAASGFLMACGIVAMFFSFTVQFGIGIFLGFVILLTGFSLGFFHIVRAHRTVFSQDKTQSPLKKLNTPKIRKFTFAVFAIIIVLCSVVVSLRATGIIREESPENYSVGMWGDTPNVILRGPVSSIQYNREVNTGYSYHIFPACMKLYVSEIVWNNSVPHYLTASYEDLKNTEVIVCYEKSNVPSIVNGQQVEVKGVYCWWVEDSLYSGTVVVSPVINESYLNPL
jgi:hypothetical protein